MKMFNEREKRWLSITLATFGVFLVVSGIFMNSKTKPIIEKKFTINIEKRQIAAAFAKSNEIKLKDIEIEINNPISVDIRDYLVDANDLDEDTFKSLKFDTSLVNINQAGSYEYKVIYKKKYYTGTIKVKEKELPNMTLTLKTIKLNTKDTLSNNPRTFINEVITDDVYNNITLDLSKVDTSTQGDYTYYVTYKGVTYQGKIEVRDPAPSVITAEKEEEKKKKNKPESAELACPSDSVKENNTCVCSDSSKKYDEDSNQCIVKED